MIIEDIIKKIKVFLKLKRYQTRKKKGRRPIPTKVTKVLNKKVLLLLLKGSYYQVEI
jgi:hypothetical protein